MSSHFTAPETWKGGFFELFIQPHTESSEELCTLLKAAWSFPSLDGCYQEQNRDLSLQERIRPCETDLAGHLFGLATLPNGSVVACGSYVTDYPGEPGGFSPAHWLGFYLPLGALSSAYNVGAYPFGSMNNVSEWKVPVESFLAELGRWTFNKAPFEYALVGFEVNPSQALVDKIRAGDIPVDRSEGILWSDSGSLGWYPATRP